MPMWTCDNDNCVLPAVRIEGACQLCSRHLCKEHLQPAFHHCPKWEDADAYDPAARTAEAKELTELFEKVNIAALIARATHLRHGNTCSIPSLKYDRSTRSSTMGGMNYHIPITFADGVIWLARIRRFNATSPPPKLRDFIVKSEYGTLRFLEKTLVPAPKVFDFALEGTDNPVGVGYILMEKLAGKSLRWALANDFQKQTVLSQLADSFIEVQKHPLRLLGSLDDPTDLTRIGAFASDSTTDFVDEQLKQLGPFRSLYDYHCASIHLTLDLILRGELYAGRTIDAYLIHLFLLDLAPVVSKPANGDQEFYLKHADDKGDHILVDEQYNITGIVDWEWAHTYPLEAAFNSPIAFFSVATFYSGCNDLSDDERFFAQSLEDKGSIDLAQAVRNGRLLHRFAFCCNYDLTDWDGFLGLFKGLRDVAAVDASLEWDDWKTIALKRYEDDKGLQALLSRE